MVAINFGVISQNININNAKMQIIIMTPILLKRFMANAVAIETADKLTSVLPINIALNIFDGFSTSLFMSLAFLLFSSARLRILNLFTVVNVVSADEKKADSSNSIPIIISCVTSLESKVSSPNSEWVAIKFMIYNYES
jgi:hypothetical protein